MSGNTFKCSSPNCASKGKKQDSSYQSQDCPEYCLECVLACAEKHLDGAFNPDDYQAKILAEEVTMEAYGLPVDIKYEVKIGKKKCIVMYRVDFDGMTEIDILKDSTPKLNDDEQIEVEECVEAKSRNY